MGKIFSTIYVQESNTNSNNYNVIYGTILQPSLPHQRYYRFPTFGNELLPAKVDLRIKGQGCYPYPLIGEQNSLSNCSSMAVITAFECTQRKKLNENSPDVISQLVTLSPLYNYYYARKFSNSTGLNTGTSLQSSIHAMMNGCSEENKWPYNPNNVNVEPSIEAQQNALKVSTTQTEILEPSLENLKTTLHAGYSILCTFAVTKALDQWFKHRNQQVSTGFMLPVEEFSNSDIVDAHTVLIVGYDDFYLHDGAFLCRNSWGPQFGIDGHFWLSYPAAIFPNLVNEYIILKEICVRETPTCVNKT